jgi:hypothetical protein
MKRIWPSLNSVARLNISRQVCGLMKGSSPSMTSISANAPSNITPTQLVRYLPLSGAVAAPGPPLRMARKNSLFGSSTITSERLRKVAR